MYTRNDNEIEEDITTQGGEIDVIEVEKHAVNRYVETPRFTTILHHVRKNDDSLFYCIEVLTEKDQRSGEKATIFRKKTFLVPQQDLLVLRDKRFGMFVFTKVIDHEDSDREMWLISGCVSQTNRVGFTVPFDKFTPSEVT